MREGWRSGEKVMRCVEGGVEGRGEGGGRDRESVEKMM